MDDIKALKEALPDPDIFVLHGRVMPKTNDPALMSEFATGFYCSSTLARLLERLEEAERDAARVNWMERNFKTCTVYMNGQHPYRPNHRLMSLAGPTFRDAIDAAMAQEKQT